VFVCTQRLLKVGTRLAGDAQPFHREDQSRQAGPGLSCQTLGVMRRRQLFGVAIASALGVSCSRENSQETLFTQAITDAVNEIETPRPVVVDPMSLLLNEQALLKWQLPEHIQATMPALQRSTAASLLVAGSKQRGVSLAHSRITRKLKVISPMASQIKRIFEERQDWEEFYRQFPGSSGLLSFSNAGFNSTKTQAAFVTRMACGGLCGSAHLILMAREGVRWRTKGATMLWVS